MQIHALFAESEALASIAELRAELDPDRAARFPLHVTVAYSPRLMPSTQSRADRVELKLGAVAVWPEPDVGIYLDVEDRHDWLRSLRVDLGEPDVSGYLPHVTLLHHTTVKDGSQVDAVRRRFERIWMPTTAIVTSLVAVDGAGTIIEHVSLT